MATIADLKKAYGVEIYASNYFGKFGAIALAENISRRLNVTGDTSDRAEAVMLLLNAYYSAIGYCVAKIKRLRIWYAFKLVSMSFKFFAVLSIIEQAKIYRSFDSGQDEVFMAGLLLRRRIPFVRDHNESSLVMILLRSILNDSKAKTSTRMLAKARCINSHLFVDSNEFADFKENVSTYKQLVADCRDELVIAEVGWECIARVARLIGDEELQKFAAKKDGRPDVVLKHG